MPEAWEKYFSDIEGYDSENPIDEQHPEISRARRMALMNTSLGNPEVAKRWLEDNGFEVEDIGDAYDFAIRRPGEQYYRLDPTGLEFADFTDVLGGAATYGGMFAGGVKGGLLGGPPGAVAGSAAGAAAVEAGLGGLGKMAGMDPTLGEFGSGVAREAAIGGAGEVAGRYAGPLIKGLAGGAYKAGGAVKRGVAEGFTLNPREVTEYAAGMAGGIRPRVAADAYKKGVKSKYETISLLKRQLAIEKKRSPTSRAAKDLEARIEAESSLLPEVAETKISAIRAERTKFKESTKRQNDPRYKELQASKNEAKSKGLQSARYKKASNALDEYEAGIADKLKSYDLQIEDINKARLAAGTMHPGMKTADISSAVTGKQAGHGWMDTNVWGPKAKKEYAAQMAGEVPQSELIQSGRSLSWSKLQELARQKGLRKASLGEEAGGDILSSWDRASITARLLETNSAELFPHLVSTSILGKVARVATGKAWGPPMKTSMFGRAAGKVAGAGAHVSDFIGHVAGLAPKTTTATGIAAGAVIATGGAIPASWIGTAVLTSMAARGYQTMAPRISYVLRQMANDRGVLVANMLEATTIPQSVVRAGQQALTALSTRGEKAYKASLYMLMQKPEFRSWLEEQVGGVDAPQKQDEEAERQYTSDAKAFAGAY